MSRPQPLNEPLNAESQDVIGKAFFESEFVAGSGVDSFETFFKYYDDEVKWLQAGRAVVNDQTVGIVMNTHDDVIVVVQALRDGFRRKRSQIRTNIRQHFKKGEEEGLNRSIDIAARLWSMVNIKESIFNHSTIPPHPWNDDSTLESFFANLFPQSRIKLNARESRVSPHFTVAFMVDVCGLEIQWTTSLEDHLRLERQSKTLWLFPFKRVLAAYIAEPDSSSGPRCPLPRSVLQETIKTYDVLFPSNLKDKRTQKFLKAHKLPIHDIAPFNTSRSLNLQEYDHWRDRLLELYDEVFMAPPVSWSQLWRDTRNPQQFWTFWIALLILVLTLISTATSIAQTWASFRALGMV